MAELGLYDPFIGFICSLSSPLRFLSSSSRNSASMLIEYSFEGPQPLSPSDVMAVYNNHNFRNFSRIISPVDRRRQHRRSEVVRLLLLPFTFFKVSSLFLRKYRNSWAGARSLETTLSAFPTGNIIRVTLWQLCSITLFKFLTSGLKKSAPLMASFN